MNTQEVTQQQNDGELLDFFKALGDANRLKILGMLANETLAASDVAERLGLRPADAYKHLSHLEKLGLVEKATGGYRASAAAVERKARAVLVQSRPKADPNRFEGDAEERKILNSYCNPDGTLRDIPTKDKKLRVVLNYLLPQFSAGQRYTEKQVNETLKRYHEDYASLRRYLVDYGLMARENGEYWVVEIL
ncbi:MAG: DUF2087 domain-containing protein [Chloroflexota bacterium]